MAETNKARTTRAQRRIKALEEIDRVKSRIIQAQKRRINELLAQRTQQ